MAPLLLLGLSHGVMCAFHFTEKSCTNCSPSLLVFHKVCSLSCQIGLIFQGSRKASLLLSIFHVSPRVSLISSTPFPWWLICAMSYYRVFGAKRRHVKTRQMGTFSCFRMATFRPARQRYDKQGLKRERSPRKNPPNDDFFVFSHGDLSPRHTKVRDILCVAFSATVCRGFAWRGERSPCENPTISPFGGFSRGDLSRFRPENTFIRHGVNQPP